VDFFARQEQTRRSTRRLVLLFGLAFLAVALATAFAATLAYAFFVDQSVYVTAGRGLPGAFQSKAGVLAGLVAGIMGLMVLASLFRTATLSKGGGQVARMLGATEIRGDEADPLYRRLVNVVEEMAIASGLPVPEIYVLEQEAGINAFAAGLTHADAAIAVTRGSLERLTRSELQGVIAHEFSHVLNGDMRLNQRLIGFSFGILVLTLMGRWMLRGSRFTYRSRNRGAGAAVFIGLALTIIGGIGVLLSRLIKAAVSREREALADASAVQFTREPQSLAGALKKIGGYTAHLSSVETEEVAHMLFGRGAKSFRGLFATHPPLDERIKALDPTFEPGNYVVAAEPLPRARGDASRFGAASMLATDGGVALDTAIGGDDIGARIETAGTIERAETGAALRGALPEELYEAAHHAESSWLLVLSLSLSAEAATLARQSTLLENRLGAERANRCRRLRTEIELIDRRLWLPLVELAVPALKRRPPEHVRFVFDLVTRLVEIDGRQSLFEYALQRLLRTYFEDLGALVAAHGRGERPNVGAAVYTTLATIAAHGHTSRDVARAAARAGLEKLSDRPPRDAEAVVETCLANPKLGELDRSIEVLAKLRAGAKRQVLAALLTTIQFDERIGIEEVELFRVVAATLGCPIPPTAAIR
jgi:Zn-dependent protease with chaperone function